MRAVSPPVVVAFIGGPADGQITTMADPGRFVRVMRMVTVLDPDQMPPFRREAKEETYIACKGVVAYWQPEDAPGRDSGRAHPFVTPANQAGAFMCDRCQMPAEAGLRIEQPGPFEVICLRCLARSETARRQGRDINSVNPT